MKTFHFSLLWNCNQGCFFCAKGPAPKGANPQFSLGKVITILREARKKGYEDVSLDGGEPTLRPDLHKVIRGAIDAGYKKITVMTNAVVLSDEKKVREIAKAHKRAKKLVSFCVSLHSHREAVSEKLTRSENTFSRTIKGIANLTRAGFKTGVYHVITTWNYKDLPDFAKFIAGQGKIREATFSYIYPARHILKYMYLYPKLSDVRPYFKKALRLLKKANVAVSMSNCTIIPFCLLKGAEKLYIEAYMDNLNAISRDTHKAEEIPFFLKSFDRLNRAKYGCCNTCAMDKVCGGVWKFYAIIHGTREIAPYKGTFLRKILVKLAAEGGKPPLFTAENGYRPHFG